MTQPWHGKAIRKAPTQRQALNDERREIDEKHRQLKADFLRRDAQRKDPQWEP
jgi:hypothetical protein